MQSNVQSNNNNSNNPSPKRMDNRVENTKEETPSLFISIPHGPESINDFASRNTNTLFGTAQSATTTATAAMNINRHHQPQPTQKHSFYSHQAAPVTAIGINSEAEAIDKWFENLSVYENNLVDLARNSASVSAETTSTNPADSPRSITEGSLAFAKEMEAMTLWFSSISEAERTTSFYTLIGMLSRVQLKFFQSVIQQRLNAISESSSLLRNIRESSIIEPIQRQHHSGLAASRSHQQFPLFTSTANTFDTSLFPTTATTIERDAHPLDLHYPSSTTSVFPPKITASSHANELESPLSARVHSKIAMTKGLNQRISSRHSFTVFEDSKSSFQTTAAVAPPPPGLESIIPSPSISPLHLKASPQSNKRSSSSNQSPLSSSNGGSGKASDETSWRNRSPTKTNSPEYSSNLPAATNSSSNAYPPLELSLVKDIPGWMRSMRLHKYTVLFSEMTWKQVVSLQDEELINLGVNALGARRKMLKVFEEVQKTFPSEFHQDQ